MRRFLSAALVLSGFSAVALAADTPNTPHAAAAQQTCGQSLKQDAKYNDDLADMANAIADSYEAHAKWVGNENKAAKSEHDALMKVARMHRDLANEAKKLSDTMSRMENLPVAQHNMQQVPSRLADTMDRAIKEMRDLSSALTQRADNWNTSLQSVKGVGGTGGAGMEMERGRTGNLPSSPEQPNDSSTPISPDVGSPQDVPSDQPNP